MLDRVRLPSYGAYLLRSSSVEGAGPFGRPLQEAQRGIDLARRELDLALDAHRRGVEAALVRLESEAAEHLGAQPEDDIVVSLRGKRTSGAGTGAALGRLADLLRHHEMSVGDGSSELVTAAQAWLASAPDRRDEATRRRAALVEAEANVAAARELAREEEAVAAEAQALEEAVRGELAAARGMVAAAAEAHDDAQRAALALVDDHSPADEPPDDQPPDDQPPDGDALVVEHDRDDDEADLTPAAARTGAADPPERRSPVSTGDLEVQLLARFAGVRSTSCAGSSPMVFDDPLVGLTDAAHASALRLVERLSTAVQVIWFSDDPRAVQWAEGRPAVHVALIRP